MEKEQQVTERLPTTEELIERTRLEWDAFYRLLADRRVVDPQTGETSLHKYMRTLRGYFERQYAEELQAEQHREFRKLFYETFDRKIMRSDRYGYRYALMMLLYSVRSYSPPRQAFCPAPPDPDDPTAVDEAIVDRPAFIFFLFQFLMPQLDDFFDCRRNMNEFVEEMVSAYWSLMPADPVERTGRGADRRSYRIVEREVSDDGGRTSKRRRGIDWS